MPKAMKSGTRKRIAAAVAAVSAATALIVTSPGSSTAAVTATPTLQAFGITADGLTMASFTTDKPGTLNWVKDVTGLSGDTKLVGIDHRVQNGLMYGLGEKGGIYTITTPPTTPDVVVTKVSQLKVALYGTSFDIDFNPAADRLRVISNNGQNLRHNLNDGTTVADSNLNIPPTTTAATGVTGAAYTNNDLVGSTGTTLTDVDTYNDQITIQSPPNAGNLVATGLLGFDANLEAGYDIFSSTTNGRTTSNLAFASLTPYGGRASFYSVDILTGTPALIGTFPNLVPITDFTITISGS
ncbi:DUF4394 domain-containing protein [Streptomyces turgidiscabies]|uniref:DUF4394 domain-containing protein n=1 Tax=Streptomyces turgidiscabies (strain Car8) TaxID=698760 RepID=L7F771_STRT8|nr:MULTISPECIES: DUF4394 domain-containing protein [Streptomyces]ELP66954.1 hypothetical protein STRTUCAR8_05322 [Streptomyces turgidiscabies Car8]MDX3492359.1 DUF4394 domain-containing protein [Streptomyces turgidiscabies]GAQ69348.1 hypothetical protein T45_01072 [Streptomyces turgidiscabies]